MHADRTIDIVVTLGQGFDIGRVVSADADTQEVPYPTLAGRIQGGIQRAVMGGKVEAIKVTMGIYEHKGLQLTSYEWDGRISVVRPGRFRFDCMQYYRLQ
jgi:hypothetical protein